jgi:hypothetical protein
VKGKNGKRMGNGNVGKLVNKYFFIIAVLLFYYYYLKEVQNDGERLMNGFIFFSLIFLINLFLFFLFFILFLNKG